MKALALTLPLLVLAPLLLLQRMEAWCARPVRTTRRRRTSSVPTPSTTRISMARNSATTSPPTVAEVRELLLRDPPPPPGYVDPLEDDPLLSDLVAAPREVPEPSHG